MHRIGEGKYRGRKREASRGHGQCKNLKWLKTKKANFLWVNWHLNYQARRRSGRKILTSSDSGGNERGVEKGERKGGAGGEIKRGEKARGTRRQVGKVVPPKNAKENKHKFTRLNGSGGEL